MTPTSVLAPTLLAVSLGNLAKEKGFQVLKKAPPPTNTRLQNAPVVHLLQELYARWFGVSSLARFFVSGNLGNVCFFFIERFVFLQLSNHLESVPDFVQQYCETVSFFIAYVLQIVTQHFLHALLVYGLNTINTREKYFKTLVGQVYAYAIALFGSTTLNLFLIQAGLDKTVAFFSTMVIFACINYFLIGWIVKRALKSAGGDEAVTRTARGVLKQKADTRRSSKATVDPKGKKTAAAAFDSVRKVRRGGGAFGVLDAKPSGGGWIAPMSSSVHQIVLDIGDPVDVDRINKQ